VLGTVLEMSDDRESRPTPILASDAERERTIALLRDAVGEGRLTLEEFSEGVEEALVARGQTPGFSCGCRGLTAMGAGYAQRIARSGW